MDFLECLFYLFVIGIGSLVEAHHKCPSDFSFVGKRCYKQTYDTPIAFCPPNSILQDLHCVTTAEPEPVCPPDSQETSDGICVVEFLSRKVPFCQEGFELVERDLGSIACEREIVTEVEQYCGHGFELAGSGCFERLKFRPTSDCESHERFENHECVSESVYDCDNLRQLEFQDINFGAQERMDKRQCKRYHRRQARLSCSSGKVLSDCCVNHEPQALQYRCEGIVTAESECKHLELAEVQMGCPYGYEEVNRGGRRSSTCKAFEEVSMEVECQDGFFMEDGLCLNMFPATMRCNEGYKYDGNNCVQTCYTETVVEYVAVEREVTTCIDC